MSIKLLAVLITGLCIISCSKEESKLSELDETIFVRHKNADMPAYVHGNGSDKVFLIILHGGPGGYGLSYRANTILKDVEKNNAVVYFDQRGSGNSQGSYSKDEVSVDIMADDVLALAKVIKYKYGEDSKLFLMGHSWGGALGPATLLKDQDEFAGWINVAGAHDPKGMFDTYKVVLKETAEEQIVLGNSTKHWEEVLDIVQNIGQENTTDNFLTLNKEAHKGEAELTDDGVIVEAEFDYGDEVFILNPLTIAWNGAGISDILADEDGLWEEVSFTEDLSDITIPSMVLWGKYDLVVPAVYAQEAFDNLGSSDKELFIFDKSGHGPMYTEPELFADKLIDFINRN